MTTIGSSQNAQNNYSFVKHAANLAAVTMGTSLVVRSAKSACNEIGFASAAEFGACNRPSLKNGKLYQTVSRFAEAFFPKGGKVSKAIERYVGKGYLIGGAERMIKELKGKGLVITAATAAILGIAGLGTYIAGKINGKN